MISAKFGPSTISSGGLKIAFLLKCLCYKQAAFDKMKTFVQILYKSNFVGIVTKDNSGEKDKMAIGIVSDSHLHDDQQFVGYSDSDIIGTVTEEIIATTKRMK